MRLAPFAPDAMPNPVRGAVTLDGVLAQNARRNPEGLSLLDPASRFEATWAEADRAVSALAEVFLSWRLGEDAVVGVQLGSSAEGALTALALMRAGLIPAMLPLPWRRAEMARALVGVGASAVVCWTERGGARLADAACEIAWSLDGLRFVGCFGPDAPDGATPLDAVLAADPGPVERSQPTDAADHVAIVTFDAGCAPVPRSHNDLIAAAIWPLLAARLSDRSALLSTLDLAGLAGLATGLAPWLATGARASFHQASTTEAFARAATELNATHVALPGRAAERLAADGAFGEAPVESILAVWRAPEGRGAAKPVGQDGGRIVDIVTFGELGLVAAARSTATRHPALPLGPVGPERLEPLIDLRVVPDGRLYVRGPACPQAAFPAAPGAPTLALGAEGYLDAGLAGIPDRVAGRVTLGGRRRGVVQVGGVALAHADLEEAVRFAGLSGTLAPQDDAVFGARLALAPPPDAPPVMVADAAKAIAAAGFGPALAPAAIAAEETRRSA